MMMILYILYLYFQYRKNEEDLWRKRNDSPVVAFTKTNHPVPTVNLLRKSTLSLTGRPHR